MRKWTRRAFIGTGSLVGGGFVLGVAGVVLAPSRHSIVSDDAIEKGELTTWITVTPDNLVTVLVPHCEMGQGAQTALAMMAAEEMAGRDWTPLPRETAMGALLSHITGDADATHFQPMNVNFGLFPPIEATDERGKRLRGRNRKQAMSARALVDFDAWLKEAALA